MPTELHRADVQRLMADGAPVIEVLPREEYEAEHIPGAISIPLKQLNAETTGRLKKDRPVVVYCYDYQCDMSARAAWRLETLGFTQVCRYTAGKANWLASGMPIEGAQASVARIGELARRDVPTCGLADRVGEVKDRLRAAGGDVCIVVNEANIVLGRLRGEALDADAETAVQQVMEEGPTTYRPDQPSEETAQNLTKRGVASVLVTTSDGELIGIFYRDDVPSHGNA